MKPIVILSIVGIASLCLAGCSTTPQPEPKATLLPALGFYADQVAGELDAVSDERKVVLGEIAASIAGRLEGGHDADLTFICTHNSRRSHMSQIWAQTAARYYGLDRVHAYSGGTRETCCNPRTITAMRRAGFTVEDATTGDNPVYLVYYADDRPPVRAYSKLYNTDDNPKEGFIALMTCSAADRSCPFVKGAVARFAIHYVDPKLCDDTPTEATAYNERCREIAREMFHIMSEVRKQTSSAAARPSATPSAT